MCAHHDLNRTMANSIIASNKLGLLAVFPKSILEGNALTVTSHVPLIAVLLMHLHGIFLNTIPHP